MTSVPKTVPARGPVHTVLQTTIANYSAMIAWYKTALGLHTVHEAKQGHLTFMTFDSEHHRVAIGAFDHLKPRQPGSVGVAHTAYTYSTLRSLLEAIEARSTAGIKPIWTVHHGPTISAYYRDPDGNMIETQWDAMEPDEANRFLDGDEFAINPIGADVDPVDLLQRLNKGEPEAAFAERKEVGPRGFDTVPAAMLE